VDIGAEKNVPTPQSSSQTTRNRPLDRYTHPPEAIAAASIEEF